MQRCNDATMHSAKGLEFDRVIVVTPSGYLGVPTETEPTRKLICVALTRAKREALLLNGYSGDRDRSFWRIVTDDSDLS
jgi:superfamily I DNA/RNA helicase